MTRLEKVSTIASLILLIALTVMTAVGLGQPAGCQCTDCGGACCPCDGKCPCCPCGDECKANGGCDVCDPPVKPCPEPAKPPCPAPCGGWKKGPLPAGTFNWGGVQIKGMTRGFLFADFRGDHVAVFDFKGERRVEASDVTWWNNCLDLPPGSAKDKGREPK
jgi:hypothetical protein